MGVAYRWFVSFDKDKELQRMGDFLVNNNIIPKKDRPTITHFCLEFALANIEAIRKMFIKQHENVGLQQTNTNSVQSSDVLGSVGKEVNETISTEVKNDGNRERGRVENPNNN